MIIGTFKKLTLVVMLAVCYGSLGVCAEGITPELKKRADASMKKAADFLVKRQQSNGAWCRNPGITGLVCTALHNSNIKEKSVTAAIDKGREYMLRFIQKDGSIWNSGSRRGYPVYTTSIVMAALVALNRPEDEKILRKARRFLLDSQLTEGNKNHPTPEDSDLYGGFSYGGKGPVNADLSNTQWALEALYLTEYLDKEPKAKSPEDIKESKLAWKAAVSFISKLQELPETNDEKWVVKDPKSPEYGGFLYMSPDRVPAGKALPKGTLSSYGAMTYAGLKSMIYAKLTKDDPRVEAAVEWTQRHYTVSENPGRGQEGLFYYLQTMAKANTVFGRDVIKTEDGRTHFWRKDLVEKLLAMQKETGEWANDSGRWMESVPELVTSYSLMAMESALNTKK